MTADAWGLAGAVAIPVVAIAALVVLLVRDCEDPCVSFGPEETVTTYYAQSCGKDCTIMVPITSTYRPCLRRQSDVPPEEKTDAAAW